MNWNSNQYLKFEKERTRPCEDLISRLDGNYERILDLGSGPANSTKKLQQAFANSKITGFEADDNMIKKAIINCPNTEFIKGFAPQDFGKLKDKYNLVFSNACIHWIKEQEQLINEVSNILEENGTFAVQLPLTNESLFYNILYNLINKKWTKLKQIKNFYNLNQQKYYNLLIKYFKNISIWKTDYYHIIDNKKMVLEWFKGSGLKPYLDSLTDDEQNEFLNDLQKEIDFNFEKLDDDKCFLVMPRLFFIAKK